MALTQVQPGMLGTPQPNNFKNRIFNGGMVLDQRNAGASVSTSSGSSVYCVDRFVAAYGTTSKFTIQQNAGAINPPTGFSKYLGVTSSAATSLGAGDYYLIGQKIEGYNVSDLDWGKSTAKSVTLSFQVYSSLTGTFGGVFTNNGQTRSYPFSYSIPVANTWTPISVTVAGDTTGTWATDNTAGIIIYWSLGTGTTYSGTGGSWSGSTYLSTTGATSVVGTNGATWYITGVQLEVGVSATGFDYRPYGTELSLCERYYEKSYEIGTVPGTTGGAGNWTGVGGQNYPRTVTQFKVDKRTTPSVTFYADSDGTTGNVNIWNNGTVLKVAASNVFITSKYIGPEGDYPSVLSTRAAMYYNWAASAEL